jgi:hypothetical protein
MTRLVALFVGCGLSAMRRPAGPRRRERIPAVAADPEYPVRYNCRESAVTLAPGSRIVAVSVVPAVEEEELW